MAGQYLGRDPHSRWGLLLLINLCLTVRVLSTTITSIDGDIIDCVHIREQPAFDHPLLQNHEIQERPTNLPNIIRDEDEFAWQMWHSNGTKCPEGTVPIRRLNRTTTSQAGVEATKGHEYAIGFMKHRQRIYGTKATMNVWHPKVERVDEFSLGQIWLVSGSYNNSDLNTIEAGWQVYPELYLDYQPRFFIFWTNDAYTLTTCYNLRCPGFVQTSRTILIEGAITPTSIFGGRQTELTIQIWKDPEPGHWWLGVGFSNGTVLAPVGYWPKEIFTHLTDYAENVQWGGEIVNKNTSGHHTTTQMGSGYFPDSDKAAYMRDLQIALKIREFQPVDDLQVGATHPTYYRIKKFSNTSFSYGGSEHGGAVQFRWSLILIYLCFSIFLLL